jgi:serralysin
MATIIGTNNGEFLYGGSDADRIHGLGGADWLKGGGGADTLRGGSGSDLLYGGEGVDTVEYSDSPAGVSVSLVSRSATGGDAEGDTLNSIENIVGSDFADVLAGDGGANILQGLGGDDRLDGGGGDNALYGMAGDDLLFVSYSNGNNMLNGGPGADRIFTGFGADAIVFSSIGDVGLTFATTDWIIGFYPQEGDRLDLRGIDADVYAPGDQGFTFIGTAPFSGTPGEIRYSQFEDDFFFELQTGTSTDIEGVFHVSTEPMTPDAGWFLL